MSYPIVDLLDDFNRANGDIDGDATSVGGYLWMSPMHSGDSYHRISSNTLVANDQANQYSGGIIDHDFGQNVRVEATVTTVGTTDFNFVLRNPYTVKNYTYGTGSTYYRVDFVKSGTDYARLMRFVNGSNTTLATNQNLPSNMANGCQAAAEVYEETGGTRIRAWYKPVGGAWVLVADYLDTAGTRPTAQRIGIETNGGVGVPSTFVLDDLKVCVIPDDAVGSYPFEVLYDGPVAYYRMSEVITEFPQTALLDDFNRADESPIGGNWTTPMGASGASIAISGNGVISNNTPPANPSAYWDVTTFGPDCEAYLTISADFEATESAYVRVRVVGVGTDTFDCYELGLSFDGTLSMGRRDDGSYVELRSTTVTASNGDAIGIRCAGSRLEAWHKPNTGAWTLVLADSDGTYSSAGYIGFGMFTTDFTTKLDNFGGGTITSFASPLPQDSSGNANHMTAQYGLPDHSQVSPIISSAGDLSMGFDGITLDETFWAPDHNSLDLGDVWTVEAWIKRSGNDSSEQAIVAKYQNYGLYLNAHKLCLSRPGVAHLNETVATVDQQWHHCVITKNGSTRLIYIDGQVAPSTDLGNSTCTSSTDFLHIAAESTTGASSFSGLIDEVALYPTALSGARVLAHYQAAQVEQPTTTYMKVYRVGSW